MCSPSNGRVINVINRLSLALGKLLHLKNNIDASVNELS